MTHFSVPNGALGFWRARLESAGARVLAEEEAFGEKRLIALDPDGLPFALVAGSDAAAEAGPLWTSDEIGADAAITGFQGVTLAVEEEETTAAVLTDLFGYARVAEEPAPEGRRVRYRAEGGAGRRAAVVDLHVTEGLQQGLDGAGTVHHVAFSVPNKAAQAAMMDKIALAGHRVTQQIDRDYFWAIYFRTQAGILFEVATDEPGFAVDEDPAHLGESLRLPAQYEAYREKIEAALPDLAT